MEDVAWDGLQSTHMGSEEVSEATTYQCTGQPQPADIETCTKWLLNDPISLVFSSAPPQPYSVVGHRKLCWCLSVTRCAS